MTFQQIHEALAAAGKPVADAQLYRYLRACEIKPAGRNQRPQQYPDNSAWLIRRWLGISPNEPNGAGIRTDAPKRTARALLGLPALKRVAAKARKVRAGK